MKKIMSLLMIAMMAICASVMFASCGDDDDKVTEVKRPTVTTDICQVNKGNALVTGKILWNDNKSSKDAGFLVWSNSAPNKLFFEAKKTDTSLSTTIEAVVPFTTTMNGNVITVYAPGETVYYQAVLRNVKVGKEKEDVTGNAMNFTVPAQ